MLQSLLILSLAANAGAAAGSLAAPQEIPPDRLKNYWIMDASKASGDVPNAARNIDMPGCATVSFVVEPDGTTSHVTVRRVVPAGDFGGIAESVAKGLRFDPTVLNGGRQRVFSWLIFPFNLPSDPTARSSVMQRCAMTSLHLKGK